MTPRRRGILPLNNSVFAERGKMPLVFGMNLETSKYLF
jgi:hypothetical protein